MNHLARNAAFIVTACLIAGCSNLRGTKLLMPEQFGLTSIGQDIYIETGAEEEKKAALRDAMARAELAIHNGYGGVESHPVVNACISETCYESFGGMGSRAKVYGNHILLSPRGFNWHFLAHEWSHDEIRARLGFAAWLRLPQWFDEGLAVAISEAPEHSEEHWQYLIQSGTERPTREELHGIRSRHQWLDAVHRYGESQNAERRARGEQEVRPLYAAAGHEVRPWLNQAGTDGLLQLIRRLNEGEDFDAVYASIASPSASQNPP